ncbi:hypothetical protein [Novosphingobium mangrovi (ex Hu et al. 2023)]|nr:hypothetical protein [Novosphingobium mangrovi (ex Hu et al. 2023)]
MITAFGRRARRIDRDVPAQDQIAATCRPDLRLGLASGSFS